MKILYIANIRIPTERAHGIQIMKMCEAFANAGNEITLLVPKRFNSIKEEIFNYYGVQQNFKIKKVFNFDLVKYGRIGFLVQSFSFSLAVIFFLFFNRFDLIYSRDEMPLFFAKLFNKNVLYEAHMPRFNFFIKRFKKIITISIGLKSFYVKRGFKEDKVCVVPDSVDINKFNISLSKESCRCKLNLPIDNKIVMYTGHLYKWKGVETLAKAKEFLKEDIMIVFVGGLESDIKKFKDKYPNVKILGIVSHKEIPYYLRSADVLVLPNSAKNNISKFYTSPMKLFEYMASGVPIVASDLPSLREILDEKNSILVEADNPQKFAFGIEKIINNEGLGDLLSKNALEKIQNFSWNNRVKLIIKFLQQ